MNKFILFLFMTISNFSIADTISIHENCFLSNDFKSSYTPESYSLEKEDYNFDGYFVLKFKSDFIVERNGFYDMELFWIEDLSSMEDENSKVYYEFIAEIYLSAFEWQYERNEVKSNMDYFFHYYNLFNENRSKKDRTYLYGLDNHNINPSLFRNTEYFWNDGEYDYLIFETSFKTAVIFSNKEQNEPKFKKLFFPVSDLLKFEKISDQEMLKYKFTKKSVSIKFIN